MTTNDILILDDEPTVARALALLLGALGCKVTECTDPLKALEHLEATALAARQARAVGLSDSQLAYAPKEPFYPVGGLRFMLCDLRMPVMDGFDVLKQAKALGSPTPIIMMSGHATELEISEARRLGAAEFLLKPFSVAQLKEVLAKY